MGRVPPIIDAAGRLLRRFLIQLASFPSACWRMRSASAAEASFRSSAEADDAPRKRRMLLFVEVAVVCPPHVRVEGGRKGGREMW